MIMWEEEKLSIFCIYTRNMSAREWGKIAEAKIPNKVDRDRKSVV